jgi:hypothetical protein
MGIGRAAWRMGLAALLLIVALGIVFVRRAGPDFIRGLVVRELERASGVSLRVGAMEISLLPPYFAAREVTVTKGAEQLLSAQRVELDLSILRSLWEGTWIADVSVDGPAVVTGDQTETWRALEALIRAPASEPLAAPAFLPRTLTVRSGRIELRLSRARMHAEITDLSLEVALSGLLIHRITFDGTGRVAVERDGKRLELARVTARGRTSVRGITVDAGVIDGQSGSLRWSGERDGDRLRGRFAWAAALDPVFALLPEAGAVRGAGRIRGTVAGTTALPEITADLEARAVRIGKVEFSGGGRFRSKGDEWTLDPVRAEIFGGEAEGSVEGRLTTLVPFEARARFTRWDPQTFLELFDARTPLRGAWSGDARVGGHLFGEDDYHGNGRFTLDQGSNRLDGAASFSITKSITDVEASAEAGPRDRLRARYQVVDHSKINGEFDGKSQKLGVFGAFVGQRLEGVGQAHAQFLGTVERPVFRGEADFASLSVQGVSFGAVRGPFEISRDGFQSSRFDVADGQIQVSGRVALNATAQNDWSAIIRRAALSQAAPALKLVWPTFPDLDGRVEGTVQASGPWASLRLGARGQLIDATVGGEHFGQGALELSLSGKRWTGRGDLRRPDGASSMLRMTLEPDGRLSVDAAASGWRLERLEAVRRRVPDLAGEVTLQGSLTGSVSRPRGDVSLALANLRLDGQALGDGSLRIHTEGARATIEASLAEMLQMSGETDVGRPYGFHVRAACHGLDVGPFVAMAPGLEIRMDGVAELRGDILQPLEQGSARIAAITIERGAQKLENRAPIAIRVANGGVELSDAELTGAGQRVIVGGRWTRQEADVHASARGDLELLEALSSTVASARGRIEAEVRASRHGDEPWRYRGRARLDGGALDLAFLVGVTDLFGEIDLEERKLELRELTGKLVGGEFLVGGTLSLDSGWDLGWAIHDASLGVPSWLDYRASGNGRLLGSIAAPELSGEIEIDQAIYDRRIEWAEFLPWFRKQASPGRAGAALPVGLDLHLVADGGLYVDNNLAKAEMRSDMRIHGDREQPVTWNGAIEVLSGEFVFRRRRFTITSGSVRFQDERPTNPDLEFSGETRVDTRDADYAIQVRVSGTADSPRIQFTADDPALTENDVLALVTFGRTVSQLQSQGAGIDLSDVLALTAGPQAGKVEERIHTFFPVDRIEVEPSFSRVSGANEPRLRIAKDLAERLSAVVGTGLGSERRQDVGLEYQVTRRFSLQGVWESQTKSEAGAFGGNLKFHVPFRTLPRFSLLPRCPLSRPGEP